MPIIATLDTNGVLTGYEEVSDANHVTTTAQVAVPDGCDLTPGQYRWDGERFMPLQPDSFAEEATPQAVHAIALGFAHLWNNGTDLPSYTVDWLREYAAGMDNKREPAVKLTR
jgi:hypothetical protein